MPRSNDDGILLPRVTFDGPTLEFDFPGMSIGIAEYDEGPTGCTVFHFPEGVVQAVDIRGGSPAVIGDYGFTHAICFTGGSIYGLEAISGVAAELFARRDYSTRWDNLVLTSGAVVYDFGGRDTAIYPDKALGRAALMAAQAGRFPLGSRGAGRAVTAGKGFAFDRGEPAGQGGAFRQIGAVRIAVFTVVNPIGAIFDRTGQIVRGNLDKVTGQRESMAAELDRSLGERTLPGHVSGNTTLTLVATNLRLDSRSLEQLGKTVHSSMARAIQPFHTIDDGDVLFTVTTNEVEDSEVGPTVLGVLASELAWDAVLSSFQ